MGRCREKLVLLHGLAKDNPSGVTTEQLETMPAVVQILDLANSENYF